MKRVMHPYSHPSRRSGFALAPQGEDHFPGLILRGLPPAGVSKDERPTSKTETAETSPLLPLRSRHRGSLHRTLVVEAILAVLHNGGLGLEGVVARLILHRHLQ